MELTEKQALIRLSMLNAEVVDADFEEVMVSKISSGWPPELMTRLEGLWGVTKRMAGESVAIGKIILMKVFEFVENNPKVFVGAAVGAAFSVLASGIPFVGAIIAPYVAAIGALTGAAVGAAMQTPKADGSIESGLITLAESFFGLFVAIFKAVKSHLND
ncbi:hypothetical protein [Pseudomonas linyingensis]|uniref:hypothetical protein n=1 Tax=Pseudomonas linyingensis TaxID=915471 RepID=UPI000B7DE1E9|nr:hypothetical protein [Pseudomonas linyingensis]